MWSDRASGIGLQRVAELIQCERAQDEWLKSVQDTFRIGRLSMDSHALLHGKPTLVPGMTICCTSQCKSTWCRSRAKAMTGNDTLSTSERDELALETLRKECPARKEERQERLFAFS